MDDEEALGSDLDLDLDDGADGGVAAAGPPAPALLGSRVQQVSVEPQTSCPVLGGSKSSDVAWSGSPSRALSPGRAGDSGCFVPCCPLSS